MHLFIIIVLSYCLLHKYTEYSQFITWTKWSKFELEISLSESHNQHILLMVHVVFCVRVFVFHFPIAFWITWSINHGQCHNRLHIQFINLFSLSLMLFVQMRSHFLGYRHLMVVSNTITQCIWKLSDISCAQNNFSLTISFPILADAFSVFVLWKWKVGDSRRKLFSFFLSVLWFAVFSNSS